MSFLHLTDCQSTSSTSSSALALYAGYMQYPVCSAEAHSDTRGVAQSQRCLQTSCSRAICLSRS